MEGYHKPVLLREVIEVLNVKAGSWYLDCTLGDGGHSLEILRLGGKVVGLDVDPGALKRARKRLQDAGYSDFVLIQGNFREIRNIILQTDIKDQKFNGAIFDLGVSSLQLEDPARGFSFSKNGPLDMRMDPELGIKAWDLVNRLSRKELYELFKSLGEEKHSRLVASALVFAREVRPFETTRQLALLIERVVGGRHGKIPARLVRRSVAGRHPATQIFQALRIAINDELNALSEGLEEALEIIKKDGHILVISFHSLEDRIVKNNFRQWEDRGLGFNLTKKPLTPSEQEIAENPRSRSAKLRVFKKI